MRFLLDHDVDAAVGRMLRRRKHECFTAGQVGLAAAVGVRIDRVERTAEGLLIRGRAAIRRRIRHPQPRHHPRTRLLSRRQHVRPHMYLDSYVTTSVHPRHGSCSAGAGGRKPADHAGHPGRRPGHRRRAGGTAADRPPGVSRHLRVLRQAGLVEVRQQAQRRVYSLRPQPLAEVDEWLGRYRALWEQRLDALHTEVARGKRERRSTR